MSLLSLNPFALGQAACSLIQRDPRCAWRQSTNRRCHIQTPVWPKAATLYLAARTLSFWTQPLFQGASRQLHSPSTGPPVKLYWQLVPAREREPEKAPEKVQCRSVSVRPHEGSQAGRLPQGTSHVARKDPPLAPFNPSLSAAISSHRRLPPATPGRGARGRAR